MERRIHKKGLLVFVFVLIFIFSNFSAFAQSIPGATEAIGGRVNWLYYVRCFDGRPPFTVTTATGITMGPFSVGIAPIYSYFLPQIPGIYVIFNAARITLPWSCWVPGDPPAPFPTRPVTLPGIGSSLHP
jgi:hypothetical protein